MSRLIIRRQERRDAEHVIALIKMAARQDVARSGAHIAPLENAKQDCTGLVAEISSQVIGTVSFRMRGRRVYIFDFVVHSDFRRRGIARQLVVQLERIAMDLRARAISLQTIEEAGAVHAFTKIGFHVRSAKPEFIASRRGQRALTTVYMVKRLPSVSADQRE